MTELPKINPKVLSVLKQCTHYNLFFFFFVRIENRNRRNLWALSPRETYHDQVLWAPPQVFNQEKGTNIFSCSSSNLGVRRHTGEHYSRSYCHARKRFLITKDGPWVYRLWKSQLIDISSTFPRHL